MSGDTLERIETAVVGAALLDEACRVVALATLSADDLVRPPHRAVWQALASLRDVRGRIDWDTVLRVGDQRALEGVDVAALGRLGRGKTADQTEEHARWLRRAAADRLARSQVDHLLGRGGLSPEVFLTEGASIFAKAQQRCVSSSAVAPIDAAQAVFERLESPRPNGLPSGVAALDAITRGWQNSRLYTIAGRPAIGKTAIACTAIAAICEALLLEREHNVDDRQALFISGEMPPVELATRFLSAIAHIDSLDIEHDKMTEERFDRLQRAAQHFSRFPLLIEAPDAMDFDDIVALSQVHHSRKRLAALVIDYFGLMTKRGRFESRTRELDAISMGCKRLSRRLDIPVILLAQINRAGNDRPTKEHLRDSGQIEQDSDVVIIADREHLRNRDVDASVATFSVDKNRGGPLGVAQAKFVPHETRFTDVTEAPPPSDYAGGER